MHIHIDRVFTTASRNLGIQDFSKYIDNWIEWTYEAERYIGSKETFINKEVSYTSTGAAASGTITFAANPSAGDMISLNGVDLFFNTYSEPFQHAPNEIAIGTALSNTLTDNVANSTGYRSLQATLSGYGTNASSGHLVDAAIFAYPESLDHATYSVDSSTGILTITAKEIGYKGNDYTLESDNATATISGMNLTGGKGIYKNQQLRLPDNMVKLLAVRVGEADSSYKRYELRKTSAVHQERLDGKALRYYVQGNRLNIAHDDLDEITVVYLAYPTDSRGWPMVKDGHETAIAQYIMWQHKLIDYYNGKLPQYIAKDLEKRWYFLCGKARGDDSMPTSEEMKQIGRMWNTLIPVNNDRGLIDF